MRRPAGIPTKIPAWAWKWLKWRNSPNPAPPKPPAPKPPAPKPPAPPAPTQLTMYDSVTVSQIPLNAAAVAGYVNGMWPTFPKLVAMFPKAHRLSIAVNASADAECLDVEKGDATPSQAPAWVKRQQQRGVKRPVVYCSVSDATTVLSELRAAGVPRSQIRLWTAHYTNTPHRCTSVCGNGFHDEADATQYADHALGRNLDASRCSAGFFA